MVGAINDGRLDVHDRKARLAARQHRLNDARIDRSDVLTRNRATDDLIHELVARAPLLRRELDDCVAVLTFTTRLPYVTTFGPNRNRDGLLVGNLWAANIGLDPELPHHPVHDDFEVKLTHSVDDGLASLLSCADPERRILFRQSSEFVYPPVLRGAALTLDRDGNHACR